MGLYQCLKPLVLCLPPEVAHKATLTALKSGLVPPVTKITDQCLEQTLWGLNFKNPLGLAAGFDKDAEVIQPMLELGFGTVELGSVTPQPQAGNPKPRIFRSEKDQAVINRMGFPSKGADYFEKQVTAFRQKVKSPNGLVGVNLGKNKTTENAEDDYISGIQQLTRYADYLVINVSSPNTPGLRDLQTAETLEVLIKACQTARDKKCENFETKVPLLIKIAPDLDPGQISQMAAVFIRQAVDGLIISNTTLERPESLDKRFSTETGGLSGLPLTAKSTEVIKAFYQQTNGRIPIIGLGGISTGRQAYQKIKAGASLVQLYTGLIYNGPTVVSDILRELSDCIQKDGFKNIADAIGYDIRGHK